MPRLSFDHHDGRGWQPDAFGCDLGSEAEIPHEAAALAQVLIGESGLCDPPRTAKVSIIVRSADERQVYAAEMIFSGRWVGPEGWKR